MDYAVLSGKVKEVLKELGTPVSIIRAGDLVGSGDAVLISSTSKNMKAIASNTSSTERELLFLGNCTPMLGDTVQSSLGAFKVYERDEVNPAGTTLLYKLKVRS